MQNSLILSEQKGASLTQNDVITTKDLAESLGVDVKTIQRASAKLFDIDVVKSVSYGGRPTQVFTEAQATAIKIELQNHSAEKTMTVKDVADFLKVAESTIRNIVGKHGWARNGVQTKLNEEQVSIISREMKSNSSLAHQQEGSLLVTSKVSTKTEITEIDESVAADM